MIIESNSSLKQSRLCLHTEERISDFRSIYRANQYTNSGYHYIYNCNERIDYDWIVISLTCLIKLTVHVTFDRLVCTSTKYHNQNVPNYSWNLNWFCKNINLFVCFFFKLKYVILLTNMNDILFLYRLWILWTLHISVQVLSRHMKLSSFTYDNTCHKNNGWLPETFPW